MYLVLFYIFLIKSIKSLYDIKLVSQPFITWINIQTDTPNLMLYMKIDLQLENKLPYFFIKIDYPFEITKANAYFTFIDDLKEIGNTDLIECEEILKFDNSKTEIFLKINEEYKEKKIIVISLNPNKYLESEKFSDFLNVSIVSSFKEGFITYAKRFSFLRLFGGKSPEKNLILENKTVEDFSLIDSIFESRLAILIENDQVQRIIIKNIGDYLFLSENNSDCGIIDYEEEYICKFWEKLGKKKKENYLIFEKKQSFQQSKIILKFRLKAPKLKGSHSVRVFTMKNPSPLIISSKSYYNIFKTSPYKWSLNYPKLIFSSNLLASDKSLPSYLGLYSMGIGHTQQFNNLRFTIKTDYLPELDSNSVYSLVIETGDENCIVPVGYISSNFEKAKGFEKIISFDKGRILIENIIIEKEKEYDIGLKIGFDGIIELPTDIEKGFGVIKLLKEDTVLIANRALMKNNFNIVQYNFASLPNSYTEINDSLNKKYRGFSNFRTAKISTLNDKLDYYPRPDKTGLKTGIEQDLFFASILGSNSFYHLNDLYTNHNSNRTVIEIITHKSIKSQKNHIDEDSESNCYFYSSKLQKWSYEIDKTIAETTLPLGVTILNEPDNYNFIGGCSIKNIITDQGEFSRFRMRLQDKYFVDNNGQGRFLRGVDFIFFKESDLIIDSTKEGNLFVWKNVDIEKFSSVYNFLDEHITIDFYLSVFFYSGIDDTDGEITAKPSLSFMENGFVISSDFDVFSPLDINFSLKNNWFENKEVNVGEYDLVTNDNTSWPSILHIFGKINTIPLGMKYLLIGLEFLNPTPKNLNSIVVDCSAKGALVVKNCEFHLGLNEIQETPYVSLKNQSSYVFRLNAQFSNFLQVELTSVSNSNFSLAFPVSLPMNSGFNKLSKIFSGEIKTSQRFIALDENFNTLAYSDLGLKGSDYKINLLDPILLLSSIYDLEKDALDIIKLDDLNPDDNPVDSVWIEKTSDFIIGRTTSIKFKANCATACPSITTDTKKYGAFTFCTNFNFDNTIDILTNSTDIKYNAHFFSYTNLLGIKKYCIFIPTVENVLNPNLDASAQTFDINGFIIPDSFGISWSPETFGVLASEKIITFIRMGSLYQKFELNVIDLISKEFEVFENTESQILEIKIVLSNDLKKKGIIFLSITPGCEYIFSIKSDETDPPCLLFKQEIESKCSFSQIHTGFEIELFEDVKKGEELHFKLYGFSVKKPTFQNYCDFLIKTYLSSAKNNFEALESSYPEYYKLKYIEKIEETIESIELKDFNNNYNFISSFTNMKFEFSLINRFLLRTDYFSVDLGSFSSLNTDTYLGCYLLSQEIIDQRYSTCNLKNIRSIIIDLSDTDEEINNTIFFQNLIIPFKKDPPIEFSYKIGSGTTAFKSNKLEITELIKIDLFQKDPSIKINFGHEGYPADLFINFTLPVDMGIEDIITLKFPLIFLNDLSIHKIFAFLIYKSQRFYLKQWKSGNQMISFLGWSNVLLKDSDVSIEINHIFYPLILKDDLKIYIYYSSEIKPFEPYFWDSVTLPINKDIEKPSIFINILDFKLNTYIVKETNTVFLNFKVSKNIKEHFYLLVYFNYITEEFYKSIEPNCNVILTNDNSRLNNSCKVVGLRIEIKVENFIYTDFEYLITITNIPNPDLPNHDPKLPEIYISDINKYKIIGHSNNLIQNYKYFSFDNEPEQTKLTYDGSNETGFILANRGFYKIINIIPIGLNGLIENFIDEMNFWVESDKNGAIISDKLPFFRINEFKSESGGESVKIVIGPTYKAAQSNYILEINKEQSSSIKYSSLPFLKIKVFAEKMFLKAKPTLTIYKKYQSLPFKISSPLAPTEKIPFDLLYEGGAIKELGTIYDEQQFILNKDKPSVFLIFKVDLDINIDSIQLKIIPANELYLFKMHLINIKIVEKTFLLNPEVKINLNEILENSFQVEIESNEVIVSFFEIVPYKYKNFHSNEELENIILNNEINSIEYFDIIFEIVLNEDENKLESVLIDNLLSNTFYEIRQFFRTPNEEIRGNNKLFINTAKKPGNNVLLKIYLKEKKTVEEQKKILCKLSEKLRLKNTNIWTNKGINCEEKEMHNSIKIYLNIKSEKEEFYNPKIPFPEKQELEEKYFRFDLIILKDQRKNFSNSEIKKFSEILKKNDPISFINYFLTDLAFIIYIAPMEEITKQEDLQITNINQIYEKQEKNLLILNSSPIKNILHIYYYMFNLNVTNIYKDELNILNYLDDDLQVSYKNFTFCNNEVIMLDLYDYNITGPHKVVLIVGNDYRSYSPNMDKFVFDINLVYEFVKYFEVFYLVFIMLFI